MYQILSNVSLYRIQRLTIDPQWDWLWYRLSNMVRAAIGPTSMKLIFILYPC